MSDELKVKKEKKEKKQKEEKPIKKAGKSKLSKKKWIILAFALVLVAGGVFFFKSITNGRLAMASQDNVSLVQTAMAEKGSITTSVEGSGNLATVDAESITVPTGIKVSEVLVESGDTVAEGDVLATLDEESMKSKLATVQSEIDKIDAELEDITTDTDNETITTYISGRVKKIYAAEGENIADVMLANGSLMTISTDGLMAVDFATTSDVAVGDDVEVILSDGTTVDGTVSTISDGTCTVTMDDDGPQLADIVTVYSEDGVSIGTGELYINQPVNITGASGTIESIDIDENDEVDSGDELITLTEAATSAEYKELMTERTELVENLQALVTLAQTNAITATFSGTVSSVNLTEGELTGSSTVDGSTTASNTSTSNTIASNTTASNTTASNAIAINTTASNAIANNTTISNTMASNTISSISTSSFILASSATNIPTIILNIDKDLVLVTPVIGGSPKTVIGGEAAGYTGTITWGDTPPTTFAAETVYTAKIELTANEEYEFSPDIVPIISGANMLKIIHDSEGKILTLIVTYTEMTAETKTTDNNSSSNGSTSSGDGTSSVGSTSSGDGTSSVGSSSSGGSTSSVSSSSSSGNSSSATTASTASSDTTDSSSSSSSSSTDERAETTAFTITSDESMLISITVDELDILSIEVGQAVTVTLDAIDGEFTGEVTEISDTASASGGVVSYAAEVTISKQESMLAGMSASATIIIDSKEDIVTIPVSALQEAGNRVFVYTELDSETNALSGEVEVETGLSDGTKVEITSGLSEGDTVYYIVVTETSNSSEETQIIRGFGGTSEGTMVMPSGAGNGEMPSREGGGTAPGGGMSGGE